MKIWIEYQNRYENGEKGEYKIFFLDNPNLVKLVHGENSILYTSRSNTSNDSFTLKYINGLIIEPNPFSKIEKRMAEHIETEWKKIGE